MKPQTIVNLLKTRSIESKQPRLRNRLAGFMSLAAVLVTGFGCDSRPSWETPVQSSGKVVYQGKPIAGAQVTLYPVDQEVPSSVRPTATTAADGSFQLSTFAQHDGAPAGDYRVAIVWHPLVDTGSGPVRGDNKLPARYAKPNTSPVDATIQVAGGQLPAFELKR